MQSDAIKFLSIGSPFSRLGNNIAFAKEDKTLAFFDFGPKIGKVLESSQLLENEAITNVIAIGTHTHGDHIKGAATLSEKCDAHKKKLMFLMPDIKRQREQLYSHLKKMLDRFETIEPDGMKALMNLKSLDFEAMRHSNRDSIYRHEPTDTTAIIIGTKTNDRRNKVIYAADNNDPNMVKSFLTDEALARIFLEMTFEKYDLGTHQTLKKLEDITGKLDSDNEIKKRIFCMHFHSNSLHELVKRKGYSSARDLLYDGQCK